MSAEKVPPAVSFENISRAFSGVPVLRDVSFEVEAGSVLALLGENGAGKSTLMNILGGNLRADGGRLRVAGAPYAPRTPDDARAAGIAFVHQELNLFANLTVAENLCLQAFPRRYGLPWIDSGAMAARSRSLLEQVGLEVSPDTILDRLSAGERQLVEIARAVGARARVLILDEPTTSLSSRERERLVALVRDLRARGLGIIYISHDLDDVLRLSDAVAVLRDGEVVARGRAGEFSVDRVVSLMIGRQVTRLYPPRRDRHSDVGTRSVEGVSAPLFEVCGITEPGVVREISFALGRGDVLGIFGLMGAGRSELARILFGVDAAAGGEVRLDGRPLTGGPRERMRRGLALLTEDRRHDGLCLDASVSDNLVLATLAACCRTPVRVVDQGRVRSVVSRIRDAVRLSPATDARQPVRRLSGGNQQKVVLGRWLLAAPRVLILDEPTRGVDMGARAEIYPLIREVADRGAGVLIISSDIEELTGLCDRILVMRRGELSAEFTRTGNNNDGSRERRDHSLAARGFDREQLLTAALPEVGT